MLASIVSKRRLLYSGRIILAPGQPQISSTKSFVNFIAKIQFFVKLAVSIEFWMVEIQ
jgi:hypothetical protein